MITSNTRRHRSETDRTNRTEEEQKKTDNDRRRSWESVRAKQLYRFIKQPYAGAGQLEEIPQKKKHARQYLQLFEKY